MSGASGWRLGRVRGYLRTVPAGYSTVVYGGYSCYFVGGVYYRAVMYQGATVYVVVN